MKINKKWFTFVELIVSTTIIVILSAIWFVSYTNFLIDARDSQRKSDLAKTSSSLKLYKQKRGIYPNPWEKFNLTYSGTTVWIQGLLNEDVILTTIDKIPNDPYAKVPYMYSITNNKQEFQIAITLENDENSIAMVEWNYRTVSKNVLPNIVLAIKQSWDLDVVSDSSKFIFDSLWHNLPYDLETWEPYSDWTDLQAMLTEAENKNSFWQNSDYRSCSEIRQAWKFFGTWTYEIIDNSSWVLTGTWCNSTN